MTMLLAVLSPFVLAFLAPALNRFLGDLTPWVLASLPALLFVFFAMMIGPIADGETLFATVSWVPSLGVDLAFMVDGLSVTFALLILGIGTCVVLYAGGYLHGHPAIGRFYLALLLFMGAMLGVVLADNLITLFIFWELTSFSSFLLIGFNHESQKSRDAAIQALVITGLGGLAMLGGLILMGRATGTWSISEILAAGDILRDHELYLPIFILVLCGAFTKSAQFPFHFWLPGAMQAPTPVSAYLHSATMVKAGVYLLARLNPALGGTDLWMMTLSIFGGVTMLVGSIVSLMKTDMKLVLAGSTIMALGALVMLIGIGTDYALIAMGTFLVAHSLYKGALFMVAGSVDHEAGTREVPILGGLRKLMPITFAAAAIACLSMAGLPPFFGFIGKELIYEAVLGAEWLAALLVVLAVASSVMIFAVGGIVAVRPFFGPEHPDTPKHAHEAPILMLVGPVLLAALSLVFGLLASPDGANLVDVYLLTPLATAIAGQPMETNLHLWHGFNLPLALTGVTIALGVLTYRTWDRTRAFWQALDPFIFAGCQKWFYEKPLAGLFAFADWLFRNIQNGNLRFYFMAIFGTTMLGLAATIGVRMTPADFAFDMPDARFYEWMLCILIVVGAVGAAQARNHLTAIITLGIMGYSIALLFVAFGAPDLAMTQFLVETLTVILVALVLIHLPQRVFSPRGISRARDLVLSGLFGAMMTLVMLAALRVDQDLFISEYYAANSVPKAYGTNIVNVILVDFRSVDTFGEIIVLAIAGIGVIAMLKYRTRRDEDDDGTPAPPPDAEPATPPPDADADPPEGAAAAETAHPEDPRDPATDPAQGEGTEAEAADTPAAEDDDGTDGNADAEDGATDADADTQDGEVHTATEDAATAADAEDEPTAKTDETDVANATDSATEDEPKATAEAEEAPATDEAAGEEEKPS